MNDCRVYVLISVEVFVVNYDVQDDESILNNNDVDKDEIDDDNNKESLQDWEI